MGEGILIWLCVYSFRQRAFEGLINSEAIFKQSGNRPKMIPVPCGQCCCCCQICGIKDVSEIFDSLHGTVGILFVIFHVQATFALFLVRLMPLTTTQLRKLVTGRNAKLKKSTHFVMHWGSPLSLLRQTTLPSSE